MKVLNKRIIFVLSIVVIAIEGIVLYFLFQGKPDVNSYAEKVIQKCMEEKYKPSCYEREVVKLMDKISMSEAFQITNDIQESDPSYAYCHVLAHKVSSKEVARDPGNWKEILLSCPFGECANGCSHGVLQEIFRSEYIAPEGLTRLEEELNGICDKNPARSVSRFEKAVCYHGIGHALLYSNPHDIQRLLSICKSLSPKSEVESPVISCYDGIFMQLFQPIEPEDFALIKDIQPEKEKLVDFCLKFDEQEQKSSCWTQGWPLYGQLMSSANGVREYCGREEFSSGRDNCYLNSFHVMGQINNFDSTAIDKFCSQADDNLKSVCYFSGANSIMEAESDFIGRAVELCDLAKKHGERIFTGCLTQIVDYADYNYSVGTPEFEKLCNSLPGSWKDECFKEDQI